MSDEHESVVVLMSRALAELPAIGKDSKAPENMGGYQFRGIEDITAALKPVLAKHGLFCLPVTDERIATERIVGGQYKKTMYCVDVKVGFTFYGPRGDSVPASVWGQGTDMGDKATQKAYTSAFKSMLTIAFLIADEQNDAERHDVPDTGGTAPSGPTDDVVQAQGWADCKEKQESFGGLRAGLKGLVDENVITSEWANAHWKKLPEYKGMTRAQFDAWLDEVESEKAKHAAANDQAADEVKDAFGAEEVTA